MEDYDAASRLVPGDAAAHSSRGGCNAELGNLAGAISDFDLAILLDPDAHYNRRVTYAEMVEPLGAVEDLSPAIELDPEEPVAHYHRDTCTAIWGSRTRR